MPIDPRYKPLYGHHWRTVTRPRVLARAGGKCERCTLRPRRFEVAHLNGDPRNMADENLAALCPRCHHAADYAAWSAKCLETRRARKDRRRPLLEGM